MFFPEKHAVVWADVNLLIFQTESIHHFLRLVRVLRHFVRLRKDIVDQFHEIVVTIIGEEILGLNSHQSGNECKEGHFCVLIKRLFRRFEELEEHLNLHCMSIFSNHCLYSFKHLVHPINVPHVTIMFIFCYDSSIRLAVKCLYLIAWHKTILTQVYSNAPLVLQAPQILAYAT
jgi:hypothetical protein